MKSKIIWVLACTGYFMLGATSLLQAQHKKVDAHLKVYRLTTNKNGREIMKKVKTVSPGDTLEYRLTYINHLPNKITGLQPVLPIPDGVQYIGETAQPAIATASLNRRGNTFLPLPITRRIKKPNGQPVKQKVPPSQYRRLRWSISSLGAKDSVTVRARVWVIDKSVAKN